VSNFVSNIEIGPNKNRIAVITYSNQAEVNINLNDYTDTTELLSRIKQLPYLGKGTNTFDGLKKMDEVVFVGETPRDRQRLAILITDGVGTINRGEPTNQLATTIKSRGINVVAIGVTKNVNQIELTAIASPRQVFLVSSFSNFVADVSQVLVDLIEPTFPSTVRTTRLTDSMTSQRTPSTPGTTSRPSKYIVDQMSSSKWIRLMDSN